jgi:hypothetical protein
MKYISLALALAAAAYPCPTAAAVEADRVSSLPGYPHDLPSAHYRYYYYYYYYYYYQYHDFLSLFRVILYID